MKCCNLPLNSVVKMNRLHASIFLCLLLLVSVGHADSTLSLSRLLEPLERPAPRAKTPAPERQVEAAPPSAKEDKTQLITRDDVINALLEASQTSLHEDDSVEINIRSGFQSVSIPADAQWRLLTTDPFAPDNRGRWMPLVALEVDGEVHQRWRLTCDVALFRMVHMTTARLARGETPMSPGIRPVIANIYNESVRPVPAYEDLSYYEMVRNLGEGRFLTWDDINPRRAVRKGETVDVTLKNGPLQITMRAMSLEDGVVDDVIRLRNPRSRTEFAGVIDAPGSVVLSN